MKKLALFLVVIILTFNLKAQDIHYSQFYASPLTLNPALTGINDCNYRAGVMYRNQWHSITPTTAYTTPSLSFDINNLAARYIKTGVFSAGLLILNDQAGDGNLSNLSILASAGYLYYFDSDHKYGVSVGLQTGYVQKRVDASLLNFEEQFNGTTFDHSILTTDYTSVNSKFGYLDLNSGLVFLAHVNPKIDLYAGAAAFHITQPKETFYGNKLSKLNMRSVLHAGAKIKFNEKWSVIPSVLYMGQSKAKEINFGTNLGYHVSNANMEADIYFGGYYRLGDAANLLIGGEYKKVRLGLSYDVNVSTLNTATSNKGGFELSLSYTGCIGGLILDKPILWCPRF